MSLKTSPFYALECPFYNQKGAFKKNGSLVQVQQFAFS
jgi:hypothetical protein